MNDTNRFAIRSGTQTTGVVPARPRGAGNRPPWFASRYRRCTAWLTDGRVPGLAAPYATVDPGDAQDSRQDTHGLSSIPLRQALSSVWARGAKESPRAEQGIPDPAPRGRSSLTATPASPRGSGTPSYARFAAQPGGSPPVSPRRCLPRTSAGCGRTGETSCSGFLPLLYGRL